MMGNKNQRPARGVDEKNAARSSAKKFPSLEKRQANL